MNRRGSDEDFIEVFRALAPESCAAIVARRREHESALRPGVGGGVHPEPKHSRDLQITRMPDWQDVDRTLNIAVVAGLLAYLRRYPEALIAR